jgi:hypothetical protein
MKTAFGVCVSTVPTVLTVLAVLCSACSSSESVDGTADAGDTDTAYGYDLDGGLRCDGGIDVMQPSPDGEGEVPSGIEQCPDLSWHRYAAVPCSNSSLDDEPCVGDACGGGCPPGQLCADNSWQECACITPCANDADCAPGEACLCHMLGNWITRCVPADCRTDADCSGFDCGVSRDGCHDANRLSCRTDADVCHGDAQCDGHYCSYIEDASRWECIELWECD